MPLLLGIIAGIVGVVLFAFSRSAQGASVNAPEKPVAPAPVSLDSLFDQIGEARGVDPDLLRAVAYVESSLRIDAVRWNPPSDVSVGVMQILAVPPTGIVGKPRDDEDYIPTNDLNVSGWPASFQSLKNPALNIDIGAQILAWNIRNYQYPRGVAIYNNWAARHAAVGGPFPNDAYVAKVLARLSKLKGV